MISSGPMSGNARSVTTTSGSTSSASNACTLVACATTSRSGSCPRSAPSPSPKIVWTSTSARRMTASARCINRAVSSPPGRGARLAVSHVGNLSLSGFCRGFTEPLPAWPRTRGPAGEPRSRRPTSTAPSPCGHAVSRTMAGNGLSVDYAVDSSVDFRRRRGRASRFRPAPTTPPGPDGLSGPHSSRTHVASSVVTSGDV